MLRSQKIWQYSLVVITIVFATWGRFILESYSSVITFSPFIFFYPIVIVSVWYGRLRLGIFSWILSDIVGNYFFVDFQNFFSLIHSKYLFHNFFFLVISALIIFFSENLHKALEKQKKAQEEARVAQNEVTSFIENVTGCFFILDKNWRFVYINLLCEDSIPCSRDELLTKTLWEAYPHWVDSDCYSKLSHALSKKTMVHFDFFDTHQSKWYNMYAAPSLDVISLHFYDITSIKTAYETIRLNQAQLKRVEENLTDFVENAATAIHLVGPDGIILRANKAELNMLGYTPEEYIGHSITEFHVDSIFIEDILYRLQEKETIQNYEAQLRAKDGSIKYVLVDSNVLWEDGKFIHTRCFTRDITEEKLANLQRDIEYLITQVLAIAPSLRKAIPKILQGIAENFGWEIGLFWKVDPVLNKLGYFGMWRQSQSELDELAYIGHQVYFPYGTVLPGQVWKNAKPRWIEDLNQEPDFLRLPYFNNQGIKSGFAFPIILNEEVLGVMEFFSSKIREPNRNLLQMFDGIGSQIGQFIERKEAEEALQENQQQFNLALQAADMGYWSWELQNNQVKWSENIEALYTSWLPSKGKTFEDSLQLVHPEDRNFLEQNILKAIEKKSEFNIEFRIIWLDNSIHWINGRGQIFYNEEEEPFKLLGLGLDITKRKQTEEQLQTAYEQMEQRVRERTAKLIETNQNLQIEIAERKKVEEEVLEISQKEQQRFGSQLHDGICQDLAGIGMLTKALTQKMEKKNSEETTELKNISQMLTQTVNQARDMARGLYPIDVEGASLMSSLQELTSRTEILMKVSCQFNCPKPILIDDNHIAPHLYKIAQESINNAITHGQAQHIDVTLIKSEENIILRIIDDGQWMDLSHNNSKGIGLNIMKYRARMIKATLSFEPNFLKGTQVTCSLKASTIENQTTY